MAQWDQMAVDGSPMRLYVVKVPFIAVSFSRAASARSPAAAAEA